MTVWKVQAGADKRVRGGHPWVFSNELSGSPKGLQPGAAVTLQDSKGSFLAYGYGNPHSLIAFRAISFDIQKPQCLDLENIVQQVVSCWGHRQLLGYEYSFRVVFGENDYLPGLIFDRYLLPGDHQVYVFQVVTAGMDRALINLEHFARRVCEEVYDAGLCKLNWQQTTLVQRSDVQVRKLEGLQVLEPQIIYSGRTDLNLEARIDFLKYAEILLAPSGRDQDPIRMSCDLYEGQKTGFFLDQSWNIDLVGQLLSKNKNLESPVRILDLCCYVGQWSTKLTRVLKNFGLEVEVELVDVSKNALAYAKKNVEREGARALVRELDVLENLGVLPDQHYDIVIADPPAFIKAKKDLPIGKHAYLKFNTQAFRLCAPGGLVVSCSCSGLFKEEDLRDVVRKSIQRNHKQARLVARGGHAADHPTLVSFEEGEYLKMLVHQVAFRS